MIFRKFNETLFFPNEESSAVMPFSRVLISTLKYECICHCLPPDRTRHKVNEPKADYRGDLGERKVGHKPRLEPCWSVQLIDPLGAMFIGLLLWHINLCGSFNAKSFFIHIYQIYMI